jgi:hypothetical protein
VVLLLDVGPISGGGTEGAAGLRRVRAQGQEGAGRHEGREQRGGGPEAEQGDGVGVRGDGGGDRAAAPPSGEEGGAVALRRRAAPLRAGGLRQEGAPGYVRNVLDDPDVGPLARASSMEEKYTSAFSDENPNSCAVM